ncbi:uncharacterized protein LOC107263866 isoform X1 [Cephus cinctus]|uniref:Uncharacterized protein LOC107263866 isoform X1 n=1 Tax=Cephus cinctus TaxID=211228 RepID=A0AAJ7RAM5_CEPCN|nr:uncharacterized protein LOC107263866 isoform X1 [Cephus cinctus]
MFRHIFKGIYGTGNSGFRYFVRKGSDSSKDKFFERDVAYESEYYYKQDRELLEILKQKTQDEVKSMQNEVRTMRDKIEEYTRDINEDLRFLKGLEKDLPATDTKES